MILGLLPAYAAAEGPELLCTAGTVGKDGVCDVAVELVNAEGISMMQFSLLYDPERLAFLGSELGTVFTGGLAPTLNTLQSGEIVLSWDSLSPLQSDGTVLLLHMRLLGEGPAAVTFAGDDDVVFARDDFQPLPVDCRGCVIEKRIFTEDSPTETVAEPSPSAVPESIGTQKDYAQPTPAVEPAPVDHTPPADQQTTAVLASPDVQEISAMPESAAPTQATAKPAQTTHPSSDTQAQSAVQAVEGTVLPAAQDSLPQESTAGGLTMTESSLVFDPGETKTLAVKEDDASVYWSSSDERVATVDESGNVTAHEGGTAIITASSEDGTAYASSTVTVNAPAETEEPQKEQNTPTGEQDSTQEQNQENKESPIPEADAGSNANSDEAKSEESTVAFWPVLIALLAVCALCIFYINKKKRLQRLNNMEEKK